MDDVALLSRLVAFDTTSHRSNLPLLDFVSEYAEGRGGRVERYPSPDGTKANLVVRFGPDAAPDRGGLTLSGHVDVVPADVGEWRSDPFTLTDGGDRLFARGACDMKGFDALALNVAAGAADLKAPLVVVLTYDEELGTLGARDFVQNHADAAASLPRAAIVGEPTEMRVVSMHRGHGRCRVIAHGVAAHSGYPHLGRSAIDAMARVLVALRGLRQRWERAGGPNAEFYPEAPYPPLNVGTIRGGTAINIVPDLCVIEIGVRPLPGMVFKELLAQIREAVANAAGGDHFLVEELNDSPSMLLDEDAPIHRFLCELARQEERVAVSYSTDGGWLSRAGLDCAVFGPGSISVAHKPNEFVPKADLVRAREVLERAVERFCR